MISAAAVLLIAVIIAGAIYALPYLSPKSPIVYTVDPAMVQPAELEQAADILTERWHALGSKYRAVKFEAIAADRLLGEIPRGSDPQLILQMKSPGVIEFVDFGSVPVAAGTQVHTDLYGNGESATYHTILTGQEIETIHPEIDNFGNFGCRFQLTPQGTQILADYTTQHSGDYLGVVWDGVVLSAPQVASPITDGAAIISGFASEAQARAFAAVVRSGALPVPLK